MNERLNDIAIEAIEREIVAAKNEVRDCERRGFAIPPELTRKIENLKGSATALRNRKVGEVR